MTLHRVLREFMMAPLFPVPPEVVIVALAPTNNNRNEWAYIPSVTLLALGGFLISQKSMTLLNTALPYALIQPVLGPVGDALGKERVVVACLFVLTLALGACVVAGDIGTLFGQIGRAHV